MRTLLLCDVDGTLITPNTQALSRLGHAVLALVDAGRVDLWLATGRSNPSRAPLAMLTGHVSGWALANGAWIEAPFGSKVAVRALASSEVVTIGLAAQRQNLVSVLRRGLEIGKGCGTGTIHGQSANVVLKVDLWSPLSEVEDTQSALACALPHLQVTRSLNNVEVTTDGVSKSLLLDHAERAGYARVVAVGDSWNDLTLLKEAPVSIAAPGACREARAMADFNSTEEALGETLEEALSY